MHLIQKFAGYALMDVSANHPKVFLRNKFLQEKPPMNVIIVSGGVVVDQKSGRNRETTDMKNAQIVSVSVSVAVVNVNVKNM
jgi:hypothetical protein